MCNVGVMILAGDPAHDQKPKQVLGFRASSRLRIAAETALAIKAWPIAVVLGAQAPQQEAELRGLKVFPVVNPHWQDGLNPAIQTGFGALAMQAGRLPDAVIILVGDQPPVAPQHLKRLIAAHELTHCGIAASYHRNNWDLPALFSRAYYSPLVSLPKHFGIKRLILANARDVQSITLPEKAPARDTVPASSSLVTT